MLNNTEVITERIKGPITRAWNAGCPYKSQDIPNNIGAKIETNLAKISSRFLISWPRVDLKANMSFQLFVMKLCAKIIGIKASK